MSGQRCDTNNSCPQRQPAPNSASARSPTRSPGSACAWPGSLVERTTRCSSPRCRCHADPMLSAWPLPDVDPEGRNQDHHPHAQPRPARAVPSPVRQRQAPARADRRTRDALSRSRRVRRRMGRHPETTAAHTAATATTPLWITCPRRSPGPPAVTAKTPRFGLEITAVLRAYLAGDRPRGVTKSRVEVASSAGGRGGNRLSGQLESLRAWFRVQAAGVCQENKAAMTKSRSRTWCETWNSRWTGPISAGVKTCVP